MLPGKFGARRDASRDPSVIIEPTPDEVRAIPCVDAVADLPAWVPQAARWFVGFNLGAQLKRPQLNLSSGLAARRVHGWCEGWTPQMRERTASQVVAIRHWRVIEGDFTAAPDIEASWFIDGPYRIAGLGYVHGSAQLDYPALARWCRARRGQTMPVPPEHHESAGDAGEQEPRSARESGGQHQRPQQPEQETERWLGARKTNGVAAVEINRELTDAIANLIAAGLNAIADHKAGVLTAEQATGLIAGLLSGEATDDAAADAVVAARRGGA